MYTLLVADDEESMYLGLTTMVDWASLRLQMVGACRSGEEVLQALERQNADVILTDIRMPDLDGRALYGEIERRWPDRTAQVVFVTGDTLTSALRAFAEESGRPVIEKPFLPGDVRRIIEEVLASAERKPAR